MLHDPWTRTHQAFCFPLRPPRLLSFLCVLYTVVFIKTAFDSTQVPSHFGNQMTWNSSPSFGVFLGLLGAIGALVGSVMGLRERT